MRILALEPFYTGSHRAFLDGWSQQSQHRFTLLTLPGRLWKWRMRHSAITFAERIASLPERERQWDVLFVSAMLNLAEFRGLVGPEIASLPAVLYFHENQFTYPVQEEHDRDLHFALTNLTSILASDQIWFNSDFHRRELSTAMASFVSRMPEYAPRQVAADLATRSAVQSPGIALGQSGGERADGPPHIVWVGRWEYDKNPELFFEALTELHRRRIPFRLSVLGEAYRKRPPIFAVARKQLASSIVNWGYAADRSAYEEILGTADVVVSTAIHEFFGIAVVEAIAAGCYPLLPNRLSYPELLDVTHRSENLQFLYDACGGELTERLMQLVSQKGDGTSLFGAAESARAAVARYEWPKRAAAMDAAIERLADCSRAG